MKPSDDHMAGRRQRETGRLTGEGSRMVVAFCVFQMGGVAVVFGVFW